MREHHRGSRSRSPHRHEHKTSRHRSRSPHHTTPKKALPYGAREISRHDLSLYRPMFALYLDIQKQLDIDDLDDHEVKGRWKSFVGKWNRGELAEGWYDPTTLEKARARVEEEKSRTPVTSASRRVDARQSQGAAAAAAATPAEDNDDDDEEDAYLPPLPTSIGSVRIDSATRTPGPGASIPSLQDLRARDEQAQENANAARDRYREDRRHERIVDRKQQKERLDEIAPRAEPGTRERQLEKKKEKAEANRAFATAKEEADVEVREADLLGDEDSLGAVKRMQKENERRKNEREIRREEIMRARRAETEARLAKMKEKEDRTMAMFKEIAKARFGGATAEGHS